MPSTLELKCEMYDRDGEWAVMLAKDMPELYALAVENMPEDGPESALSILGTLNTFKKHHTLQMNIGDNRLYGFKYELGGVTFSKAGPLERGEEYKLIELEHFKAERSWNRRPQTFAACEQMAGKYCMTKSGKLFNLRTGEPKCSTDLGTGSSSTKEPTDDSKSKDCEGLPFFQFKYSRGKPRHVGGPDIHSNYVVYVHRLMLTVWEGGPSDNSMQCDHRIPRHAPHYGKTILGNLDWVSIAYHGDKSAREAAELAKYKRSMAALLVPDSSEAEYDEEEDEEEDEEDEEEEEEEDDEEEEEEDDEAQPCEAPIALALLDANDNKKLHEPLPMDDAESPFDNPHYIMMIEDGEDTEEAPPPPKRAKLYPIFTSSARSDR